MAGRGDEGGGSLRRKQDFYAGLDGATKSDDDDTPDLGRQSSLQAMQKAKARKQNPVVKEKNSNGLSRSKSDTSLVPDTNRPLETSEKQRYGPTSHGTKLPASLMTRHTFTGLSTNEKTNEGPTSSAMPAAASKATGKRKRDAILSAKPLEQQIFKGLHFYFFPNNDKHPARKMRIAKAQEFGATWQKDFNDTVTHIILDKAMDYGLLITFLKKESLPSHVIVVSENYPAECISYRMLVEPRQMQFKVKGYEMPPSSRPVSSDSDCSLQLKPAGKSVQTRQTDTPISSKRASTPLPPSPDDDGVVEVSVPPAPAGVEKLSAVNVQSTEEFDAAIRQAQELQHVPLDNDDDVSSRPSSSERPTTDDEGPSSSFTLLKKKRNKLQRMEDKFQCMRKHTGPNTETPNAKTIAILQQMGDYYDQIGDEWRLRAYRKAIGTLRNHPTKVWTKEEALALPQIGERLATKIEEIAFTNRLRRLDNAKAEPSDQILQTFMQVYGAGFAQASKWVSAGYETLDEVLQKAALTDNQRIGIEHYEDFKCRIPRAEVEQHGDVVRKALQKIDPKFEVIVGGSYRRGADTSGDIDCIITRPNTGAAHIRQVVLDQLVPALFAEDFLVAELAATSRDDGSKWHGASRIPSSNSTSPWRRIDLLLVPSDEIGAALIYFTGNDIFNRSMRLLASTKGMRLNQRGLYRDVMRGKGREKLNEGTLVEGKDEKRIFEVLGVPWRPPEHRVC